MATLTFDTDQAGLLEPAEPSARERTLDDVVVRSWSSLLVSRSTACLLCGGEVTPRYGSGPHPVGGACTSCGTEIG